MQKPGSFLFRWRGIVFPLSIVTLAVVFPPRLAHSVFDQLMIGLGLAVIIAGQSTRVLTGFLFAYGRLVAEIVGIAEPRRVGPQKETKVYSTTFSAESGTQSVSQGVSPPSPTGLVRSALARYGVRYVQILNS